MRIAVPIIALVVGCSPVTAPVSSPDHPLVKSFIAAQSLTPNWNKNIYPSVHNWDQTIELGNGLTFQILAYESVGGRFEGKYSDERAIRTIAVPGDYIYPCDIRVDLAKKHLFCKASGLAGGIYHETVIFEYDLLGRKVVDKIRVDPKLLPANPKPVTPAPNP